MGGRYNRLSTTNNFPEVTGRICPALCEKACVLGIHQPPTMIKLDEQTIIDQAWDLDIVKPMPPQRLTDQTVAVVGSGPPVWHAPSSSPEPATRSSSMSAMTPSAV